jgi:Domain of unknown function (DUF4291)
LITEPYLQQLSRWPGAGRHILARYDADSIVVYQAYRPAIADYAVQHQRFGGEFSYNRMSWIKPNFLWMMYRAGWASKEGQERILAVRLPRAFFDELLRQAVPSSFDPTRYDLHSDWQAAVQRSDVRLQWDPDHDPQGRPLQRRAIQLGLRGAALRAYGESCAISIDDITPFVLRQADNLAQGLALELPSERPYSPEKSAAIAIALDA